MSHLEHQNQFCKQTYMIIGAIWCTNSKLVLFMLSPHHGSPSNLCKGQKLRFSFLEFHWHQIQIPKEKLVYGIGKCMNFEYRNDWNPDIGIIGIV